MKKNLPVSVNELLPQLKATWALFEYEANRATEKNIKASARRSRKAAFELRRLLKEWRKPSVKEIG